jgi:hypothetical protein
MWTLAVLVILIPILAIIGLFWGVPLKRAKDLPPPAGDEWAASQELQTPQ